MNSGSGSLHIEGSIPLRDKGGIPELVKQMKVHDSREVSMEKFLDYILKLKGTYSCALL